MADQLFDFDSFKSLCNGAKDGLSDTFQATRGIIPDTAEVAKQTGSPKLSNTTKSFNEIAEETSVMFESLLESIEEAVRVYTKTENAI